MERVAVLIERCAIYERLYLTHNVPMNAGDATENLRTVLLTLCHYASSIMSVNQGFQE